MAGYSGTPLPTKLGIREGHRLCVVGAPRDFGDALGELPVGVTVARSLGARPHDVIVTFVKTRAELDERFAAAKARLDPSGGLWVAWPKKASGIATDVTEDVVRRVALDAGLVDNKVCAIDATWSGLRCVVRLADRPAKANANANANAKANATKKKP